MNKKNKTSAYADDAPLTKAELSTRRPLAEVFPDLAAYSRKRAKKGETIKKAVSIRLSPEIIDYFKSKGPNWQTRVNDVLDAVMRANR